MISALVHAASYYPPAPKNDVAWDTLLAAIATVAMIMLFALIAAVMNAREARRQ